MATSTMSISVKQCQDIIGYEFKNPHILWEALQTAGSGVMIIGDRKVPQGNKRQAVLGDAILSHVLCSRWYADGGTRGT
jgi:ribonuclease-3